MDCPRCSNQIKGNERICTSCGNDVGFPNVRAAKEYEEKAALARWMWMAQAFLVDTQQTGPLGADKFYSTNWGMLSVLHRLGSGDVMLRTMLSLEPATVTSEFYPLLFQTGETAYGKPIVNDQHPHDLVMELRDRKSTRLNSSHLGISYAVF